MPKIRSMSAGRAGASLYNTNVNGNQGGGDKKGGLASTTNKRVQYVIPAIRSRAYSNPDQRKMIFCVNQLGGVGAPSKMFATTADGSCASCSKEAKAHNFVVLAYRQLLCRGADEGGLRKYTKQILNDPRGLCIGMEQVKVDLMKSPEGKKCMSKLGSVEAQKHIDIVNEYIKKACTVVPTLPPVPESKPEFTVYDYLCSSNTIPDSEQNIPYDGVQGWGKINYPGAKVSVINDYLIKKDASSDDAKEDDFIKGKFKSDDSGVECIKLYAQELIYIGLVYDFSGVENIDTMASDTVLGMPASVQEGSKEDELNNISLGTSGTSPITRGALDKNYKYCKISLLVDNTYACSYSSGQNEFNEDGELSGCRRAYSLGLSLDDEDTNKNNSSAFLEKYTNNLVKVETINMYAESDYELPRSICMQLPTKKRDN